MVKISDKIVRPGDLRPWLQDHPPEWAAPITVRAALRVLPLVFEVWSVPENGVQVDVKKLLTLQAFRASYISWSAQLYPDHDMSRAAVYAAEAASNAEVAARIATKGAIAHDAIDDDRVR